MEKINQKTPKKFNCINCDYHTNSSRDYNGHLLTSKHKNNHVSNICQQSHIEEDTNIVTIHTCSKCNKKYKDRSGLWRHLKKCKDIDQHEIIEENPNTIMPASLDSSAILDIIKQNQEFKDLLLEQHNKIVELSSQVSVVNNNNTTNNMNQHNHFNLNFFLNETCKNAMNITEFIDNINIQMKELENVGKNGYVNGISEIILNRIKNLEVSKRPLHCTDIKRETMYIRDDNEWNKDTEEKTKLKQVIGQVAKENIRKIPEWREENPECMNTKHEQYDFCIQMMRNSLGDLDEQQEKLDDKIIKNIAKTVVVDKTT